MESTEVRGVDHESTNCFPPYLSVLDRKNKKKDAPLVALL